MLYNNEMLELAAKSIDQEFMYVGDILKIVIRYPNGNIKLIKIWNPLEDDSDALKLAMDLKLNITQSLEDNSITVSVPAGNSGFRPYSWKFRFNQPCAAFRYAVVEVAMQIAAHKLNYSYKGI